LTDSFTSVEFATRRLRQLSVSVLLRADPAHCGIQASSHAGQQAGSNPAFAVKREDDSQQRDPPAWGMSFSSKALWARNHPYDFRDEQDQAARQAEHPAPPVSRFAGRSSRWQGQG
jgi:hypothetical protein